MSNVQIDSALFADIYRYLHSDYCLADSAADTIRQQLDVKLDKLIARELYTHYKHAPTGTAEREQYRKEYLQHIGMTPSYITDTEVSKSDL